MSLSYSPLPKIRIEKISDKELIFYLEGGDQHTLPNLIAKMAIKKPHVTYSAYMIDHPLVSNPKIVILTDGQVKPIDILVEILREAKEKVIALRDILDKLLPEQGS
ncbi:MAG: RpoL/Rpb11 RNA polymerase subunit family protein [Sulfolobales archaeon]